MEYGMCVWSLAVGQRWLYARVRGVIAYARHTMDEHLGVM